MYKTLKLAKMIVISLSVVFSMVFIGNRVTVNADETARVETVNIVDTQGNILKKQTQTLDKNSQNLDAKVPGYDPAKTLVSARIVAVLKPPAPGDHPTQTVDVKIAVDADKQVLVSNGETNGEPQPEASLTKNDIEQQIGSPISSLNDGLAKYLDFANYGIFFYTSGPIDPNWLLFSQKIDFTVTYAYQEAIIPVQFIDSDGKVVGNDTKITGFLGKTGDYTPKAPDGYQLVDTKPITYRMSEKENPAITVHVVKKAVTPNVPSDNSSTNITNPTTPVTPTPATPAGSETTKEPAEPTMPNYAAKKGAVVYATKAIYLYKDANFKPSQRLAKYPKAKRVNRPMFVVTDYARSTNGTLRYKVRDVNHGTKTADRVGYITANSKFVIPVYYQSVPKSQKITVINQRGVNAYRNVNLTQKAKHYRKGTHLTVKKIVKHRLTTRYQLSNGDYVTANKKLVIQENAK
ncbi:DUF5776 domain-containing protein [Lentilactobacillus sp. TOM.63]|uniref:DUF5776 domain-containing protein n=1 Tax=Lentilactobacillus sp. TOM.63 TaxID=3055077 RepID=UPI00338DB774